MGLESVSWLPDLNPANPAGGDPKNQGDDHIRNIKTGVTATFANFVGGVAVTATEAQLNDLLAQVPTYVAKQACNLASTVAFSSIPSWANKITMLFEGVSGDGTSSFLVQIGDASAWVTTGYQSRSARLTGSINFANSSGGFVINNSAAGNVFNGEIVLTRTESGGNEWMASHNMQRSDSEAQFVGSGRIAHSAALTRVRLNFNGETGDAGNVSLRYEK